MSTDADRYHHIMDETEETSAAPVDPEVQAILDEWADGGGELPWTDAEG